MGGEDRDMKTIASWKIPAICPRFIYWVDFPQSRLITSSLYSFQSSHFDFHWILSIDGRPSSGYKTNLHALGQSTMTSEEGFSWIKLVQALSGWLCTLGFRVCAGSEEGPNHFAIWCMQSSITLCAWGCFRSSNQWPQDHKATTLPVAPRLVL